MATKKYNDEEEQNETLAAENLAVYSTSALQPSTMSIPLRSDLANRFETSYQRWKSETWMHSSPRKITEHPDFLNIVRMGQQAVPYIIEKLRQEPSGLVWALNRIFNRQIAPGSSLTIPQLSQQWIQALTR